jgi:hypothetical protein
MMVCPGGSSHKTFFTGAHVVEEWLVDEHGDFIEVTDNGGEIASPPDPDNVWVCAECGSAETKWMEKKDDERTGPISS